MNLAPLLATSLDESVAPLDNLASSTWREQWEQAAEFWSVEDAVDWVRGTPALAELFDVRSFDGLVESGPGLARVPGFPDAPAGWDPDDWPFWDEAVELRDGGFLAYPNDADWTPNLSFYAPVVPGDGPAGAEPIRLATLVFEVTQARVVSKVRLRDDADGRCARYLVIMDTGERDLSCEPQSCPNDCERVVWPRPGGVRRARCKC